MAQAAKKQASPKQVAFIEKLVVERVGGSVYVGTQLASYHVDSVEELSSHAASNVIGVLLNEPKIKAPVVAGAAPVLVEEGYYHDAEEDRVYQIVKAKSTGNLYAKVLTPPPAGKKNAKWEYAPGAMKKVGGWVKMTGESAAALSSKFGWCVCCGRLLTATESVEAGIGPICAKKF